MEQSQELGVVVTASPTQRRAFVAGIVESPKERWVTISSRQAYKAPEAVVVGGSSECPVAQNLAIPLQESSGCYGGFQRREPFVESASIVDGHVLESGCMHELPHAGS